MANRLEQVNEIPPWLLQLSTEIDSLEFKVAWDRFTAESILQFGAETYIGAPAMKDFFVKLDSPVNIKHEILDVWIGDGVHFIRGQAATSKKSDVEQKEFVVPFMWFFHGDIEGPGKIDKWSVTAGPLQTDSFW